MFYSNRVINFSLGKGTNRILTRSLRVVVAEAGSMWPGNGLIPHISLWNVRQGNEFIFLFPYLGYERCEVHVYQHRQSSCVLVMFYNCSTR